MILGSPLSNPQCDIFEEDNEQNCILLKEDIIHVKNIIEISLRIENCSSQPIPEALVSDKIRDNIFEYYQIWKLDFIKKTAIWT